MSTNPVFSKQAQLGRAFPHEGYSCCYCTLVGHLEDCEHVEMTKHSFEWMPQRQSREMWVDHRHRVAIAVDGCHMLGSGSCAHTLSYR
jgi:hypothetical protein